MVGLAVVVLLGAVLIIVGKVLPRGDAASQATPTASAAASSEASGQPGRTARQSPTPRPLGEITLLPGTPPSPSPQPAYTFNGWVRAKSTMAIHSEPRVDAFRSGTLASGELAYVWEDPVQAGGDLGWLYVQEPGTGGWIATTPNGSSLVERFTVRPYPTSGDIYGLDGGPDGYLGLATRPGRSDINTPALLVASTDGAHWQRGSAPAVGWGFAWGPAGWLTSSVDDSSGSPQIWIWNSSNGLSWDALGAWVDPRGSSGHPNQLVGSPRGYVLTIGQGYRSDRMTIWYSPDGLTWQEAADPGFDHNAWLAMVATPLGFYAWDQRPPGDRGSSAAAAAFSADGTHWVLVAGGPGGNAVQIGAVDDRLLAISPDPTTGSARVWTGSVVRDGFLWRRDPGQDQVFAGAAVSALASDGQRMAAFGWEWDTEQPMAWIRRGNQWARSLLPSAFGGIPRVAAVGPSGFVVLGYRTTIRGVNPIIWHQTADGSWAPEADPLLAVVPDPSPADCGPPPRDALDFILFDHGATTVCLGAATVTFRAWSTECDGCLFEPSGRRRPVWLAEAPNNQLFLAPIETMSSWAQAILAPSLPPDPSWTNHWVEITGRFDDPATLACQWLPGADGLTYYSGRQEVLNVCRQQFVVTAVRLVDGP